MYACSNVMQCMEAGASISTEFGDCQVHTEVSRCEIVIVKSRVSGCYMLNLFVTSLDFKLKR